MIRRADSLSDDAIKARTITVTGRLIGVIPTARAQTLMVQVDGAAEVEIHKETP